jgi:hypothetical protein
MTENRHRTLFLAGLATLLLFVPLPSLGRAADAAQDLAHLPVGALYALLILGWLRRARGVPSLAAAFLAFLLVGAVLALVEIVQPFTGRTRSFQDWVTGLLGAGGALLVAATWTRGVVFRTLGLALGGVLVVYGALPAGRIVYDVWRQRRDAPMIASFEDDLELTRWYFRYATGSRAVKHVTTGLYSLRVEVEPAQYPGATMSAPLADWRGHRALAFDLHVDEGPPLDFVVTVSDEAHDGDYFDRFNQEMQLGPGDYHIDIPLADVEAEPRGRSMDMGRIAGFQVFVVRPDRPRTFYLDAVRLVGSR